MDAGRRKVSPDGHGIFMDIFKNCVMLNIVIFGAPGSGKGTQSDLMIEKYGLKHISTGDVLRAEIEAKTELGRIAETYMDDGKLVPDSLILDILSGVLDKLKGEANGVIFDGFPRTIAQAEALDKMLAERGTAVSAVIGLEVHEEELIKRIIARGQVSHRADDNEAVAKKRLDTYHAQTLPLKDFYIRGGRYTAIRGEGAVADIFADIAKAIDAVL